MNALCWYRARFSTRSTVRLALAHIGLVAIEFADVESFSFPPAGGN